jgi:hypothetical protein
MTVRTANALLICSLALLLCQAKEPVAAAQNSPKVPSAGLSDERVSEILVALAKLDSKLKIIKAPDFSVESGDLTITVKADKPIFYDGKPYQNGAQVSGLYGQVNVSEKFYGVEVILHYLLLKGNAGYGGAFVQERVTVLYEETPRFKALHPRAFDSKPFAVNKDGSFVDRQLFGRFDAPLPDQTTQVLKQELILDSELIATIYIARTPKEIRLLGYSVPPLISDLVLP